MQDWRNAVRKEIETQVEPREIAQRLKKLTKSRNDHVALSAIKTVTDMLGVGETPPLLTPLIVLIPASQATLRGPDVVEGTAQRLGEATDHGSMSDDAA